MKRKVELLPTVFMDRDGTLIKEIGYIKEPEKVELLPYAAQAIKLLKNEGFKIIVVTNQSGVGRGYFSLTDLEKVNNRFFELLEQEEASIDKLYFCPHTPDANCECRKPKPGMVEQAKKDFAIDFQSSYIIGDKIEDIGLGKSMGLKTILVLTGYGEETKDKVTPDFVAQNLLSAANWIRSRNVKIKNDEFLNPN